MAEHWDWLLTFGVVFLSFMRHAISASISGSAVNLTSSIDAATIENLDYVSNCTVSITWYYHVFPNSYGYGNDSVNLAFLRMVLPSQYQGASDEQIGLLYDDMINGPLYQTSWTGIALDDIETACLAPQLERAVRLTDLNATQDCNATALFLTSTLGWTRGSNPITQVPNDGNATISFFRSALPVQYRNISDLEMFTWYADFISNQSLHWDPLNQFLLAAYNSCYVEICPVQGYTGNPDISGIGVLISYILEAALVTVYFLGVHISHLCEKIHFIKKLMPTAWTTSTESDKFKEKSEDASSSMVDAALFFSLSISTAGLISWHNSQSYYERLVFSSANVLALCALIVLLDLFLVNALQKRGVFILVVVLFVILTQGTIDVFIFLTDPKTNFIDYYCVFPKLTAQGYHPEIFESVFFIPVFFLLISLIVILFDWWLDVSKKKRSREAPGSLLAHIRARRSAVARFIVQILAVATAWAEVGYIIRIRNIMRGIAGDTWVEGQWGFGQILALFIWLPALLDIVNMLEKAAFSKPPSHPKSADVDSKTPVVTEKPADP